MLGAKLPYCFTSGLQYSVLRVGTREGAAKQGTEIAKVVGGNIDKISKEKLTGEREYRGVCN